MSKPNRRIWFFIFVILFIIYSIDKCIDRIRGKSTAKSPTTTQAPKPLSTTVETDIWHPTPRQEPKITWRYAHEEDPMTSTMIYTAKRYSEGKLITGGRWEDRSSTTTTTNTKVTAKRPWYQSQSAAERKKINTNTSTTTTSASSPVWVTDEGHLVLCLRSRKGKSTSVIFYSTTGNLPIDFNTVRIRFDKEQPKRFSITPVAFEKGDIDGFTITSSKEFMTMLKKATTVLIEIGGDSRENKAILTFDVTGLKWDHQ